MVGSRLQVHIAAHARIHINSRWTQNIGMVSVHKSSTVSFLEWPALFFAQLGAYDQFLTL